MKRIVIAATAAVFAAAVQVPFALACATGADGSPAPAAQNGLTTVAAAGAHYEWQYHYVGRHARLEGGWILVR